MDYKILMNGNCLIVEVDAETMEFTMENIFKDLSEKIIQRQWKSKHNDYVVYDYAPFCIERFNLIYTIDFSLSSYLLGYYKFLVGKRLNQINELEKLLLLEVEK